MPAQNNAPQRTEMLEVCYVALLTLTSLPSSEGTACGGNANKISVYHAKPRRKCSISGFQIKGSYASVKNRITTSDQFFSLRAARMSEVHQGTQSQLSLPHPEII